MRTDRQGSSAEIQQLVDVFARLVVSFPWELALTSAYGDVPLWGALRIIDKYVRFSIEKNIPVTAETYERAETEIVVSRCSDYREALSILRAYQRERKSPTMTPPLDNDVVRAAIQIIIDTCPDIEDLTIVDFSYRPPGWDADRKKLLKDHWLVHINNGFKTTEYVVPHEIIVGIHEKNEAVMKKLQAIADEQKKIIKQRVKRLDMDTGGLARYDIKREE